MPDMSIRNTGRVRTVSIAAIIMIATAGGCGLDLRASSPAPSPTVTTNQPTTGAVVTPPDSALALQNAYEQVITATRPAIVQITTRTGLGSGVVFDDQGHIVTNAHVVGEEQRFQVTSATGGAPRNARLVAAFPAGDLAVIKLDDPSGLTVARFGDSSKLKEGQIVLAMGNPLGLSGSVTSGIISALGRTVSASDGRGPSVTIPNAIQTSAPINPGNSGGALVNLSGEVIGIPTLAATTSEDGAAAPGIGFAIPSNTAKDIAEQIIRHGEVVNTRRAALGITAGVAFGPDGRPMGVNVVEVAPNGGAAQAGIRPGDMIVAVNGEPTPTLSALAEILATLKPGDQAKVDVIHQDNSRETVTVTLGELPAN